ncbi:MAG: superoxide dismutase [Ni] [Planctomycetota bacterium]|nr:superoxide dismutase [Ni] [Planctomycetota bacterium]MDA1142543.1 superoxide dismutase [Ni] [Planctomycetota bacterium]
MKTFLTGLSVLALCLTFTQKAWSHCEVPCGIYDDEMRIGMIAEHITTIEKAVNQVEELSKTADKNQNQIVRWVANKESHATEIQHIVTQYFMTQRIKIGAEAGSAAHTKYLTELSLLHELLVHAMKAKQSLDVANIANLRSALKAFEASYIKK